MEEIKNLLNEKITETEQLIKSPISISQFLIKSHEDIIDNMELLAHEMAVTPIKRIFMLKSESDGIDLIIKINKDDIYQDESFKKFIILMNEYFTKIRTDEKYEEIKEYTESENLVYEKFRLLFDKIKA
jgi:hypothetical protein